MKKLTEAQKLSIDNNSIELQEKFLQENKSVLFDIDKLVNKGKEIREKLDNLNRENARIKLLVYEQFQADVEKIKAFLGEYADALTVSEDARNGNYYYSIGENDDNKVHVTYAYGREDFVDWENYHEIDGHKYQEYKVYDIETCADGYDNENHVDFETMFNDTDVVDMFEIAVQDYLVYGRYKDAEMS